MERAVTNLTHEAITTDSGNVTFEAWTNGFAVGFRVTNKVTDKVRYLYLNPSPDDGTVKGGDDGTIFVYEGDKGDPGEDSTVCYIDTMED